MKKILLIGKDRYIGKHLKNHFLQYRYEFVVNPISSDTKTWKVLNFKIYDCIIYLADVDPECKEGTEDFEKQNQYYNRDLLEAIVAEAKRCDVKQLVYFSTIDVYGKTPEAGSSFTITKETEPNPITAHAKGKLEGEELLKGYEDESFKVASLRLPILYGPGCGGTYGKMAEILMANRNKVPMLKNSLSVLSIDSLCTFVRNIINDESSGTFHPQDVEYKSTPELFKIISKELYIPLKFSRMLGWKCETLKNSCPEEYRNISGSLVYAKDIDE